MVDSGKAMIVACPISPISIIGFSITLSQGVVDRGIAMITSVARKWMIERISIGFSITLSQGVVDRGKAMITSVARKWMIGRISIGFSNSIAIGRTSQGRKKNKQLHDCLVTALVGPTELPM